MEIGQIINYSIEKTIDSENISEFKGSDIETELITTFSEFIRRNKIVDLQSYSYSIEFGIDTDNTLTFGNDVSITKEYDEAESYIHDFVGMISNFISNNKIDHLDSYLIYSFTFSISKYEVSINQDYQP